MNQFIIQYIDGGEVKQVVADGCANVTEALAKFEAQYGSAQVISVMPAGRL